ncbi:MAG: hypothetical protein CR968_02075 [Flavobacteriia bacterium]|nr:MAG: hypothetical protein CR968_02075 [Flavobacteriia bacterium]
METPKFLLGDHADYNDDIFIIHIEFPRFILNLVNDEVLWLEDIADSDANDLTNEMEALIRQAEEFYDEQMKKFDTL